MTDIRDNLRFWLNDRLITLNEVGPEDTLLDFLRLDQRLTGAKEGCAEGDCGACTVLVGRLARGDLIYETVNACIRFLPSLDGCHVVTIEHMRGEDGGLHPVQKAMVEHHGSQCGFCTPGIIFSLYGLWMSNPAPDRRAIKVALQGNLCRCTGYAPIIRAAEAISDYGSPANDWLEAERAVNRERLMALKDGARVVLQKAGKTAILPASLDDFASVRQENSGATIIAGSTDVGLWVTKLMRDISPAIFIAHLEELKHISVTQQQILIGAGATYSEAQQVMSEHFPHLANYWQRIAGQQVRNMGTIGGNIANGSPIGDMPPVLMALGASIILRKGGERRRLALEDFFIAYGRQDRYPGDFLETILIPREQHKDPHTDCALRLHAAYKISKRRDEDISALSAGFHLTVAEGIITTSHLAFGGMAATPRRAAHAEAALLGQPFCEDSLLAAAAVLDKDFEPLSDWRASATYRMMAAKNLFRRFWLDHAESASIAEGEAAQ